MTREWVELSPAGPAPIVRKQQPVLPPQTGFHLWIFRVAEDARKFPTGVLTPAEIARAGRYRDPDKRQQFLLTRGMGKLILADYFACHPEEIHWPVRGAPRIQTNGGTVPCRVSVSHSGATSAIAVTAPDAEIGLDVEEASVPLNVPALARMTLHEQETEWWQRFPHAEQEFILRRIWTVKEALLKGPASDEIAALLSIDLGSLLSRLPPATVEESAVLTETGWQVGAFEFDPQGFRITSLSAPGADHVHPRHVTGGWAWRGNGPLEANCRSAALRSLPHEFSYRIEKLRDYGVQANVAECLLTDKIPSSSQRE